MIKFNGETGEVGLKGTDSELYADLAMIVFHMMHDTELDKNYIKIAVTEGIKLAKEMKK